MIFVIVLNRRNKRIKKNLKKFSKAKFNYGKFVKNYYMEKGEAYISAKVSGIEDIISRYSVKDYEWVNPEFVEYIEESAYYIPVEESIILEITGAKFTDEEKETIEKVIKDYFGLQLGDKMIDLEINKRRSRVLLGCTLITLIIFFSFYSFMEATLLLEVLAFGFWFFGWEYAEFAWLDRSDLKTEKLEAGQLATLKIQFLEEDDNKNKDEKKIEEQDKGIIQEANT